MSKIYLYFSGYKNARKSKQWCGLRVFNYKLNHSSTLGAINSRSRNFFLAYPDVARYFQTSVKYKEHLLDTVR